MPKDEAFERALKSLSEDSSKYGVSSRLPKGKRPISLMISFGLEEPEGEHEMGESLDGEDLYEEEDEEEGR